MGKYEAARSTATPRTAWAIEVGATTVGACGVAWGGGWGGTEVEQNVEVGDDRLGEGEGEHDDDEPKMELARGRTKDGTGEGANQRWN